MKSYPFRKISVLALFLVVAAGCAGWGKGLSSMQSGPTLYERLGGKPAIEAVVGDFLGPIKKEIVEVPAMHILT